MHRELIRRNGCNGSLAAGQGGKQTFATEPWRQRIFASD
jgi:hypothetical protein